MRFLPSLTPGLRMTTSLALADLAALYATSASMLLIRSALADPLQWGGYWQLGLLLTIFPVLGFAAGIYQSIALPPPRELKKLSLTTTLTFLFLSAFTFFTKGGDMYSRLAVGSAWTLCLFTIPLARAWVRHTYGSRPWWGHPVILFGDGTVADEIQTTLSKRPALGLRIVAHVAPECALSQPKDASTTCLPPHPELERLCAAHPGAYALALQHCYSEEDIRQVMAQLSRHFPGVILLPAQGTGGARIWLMPLDLGGHFGLMVRQNLLDPSRLRFKRLVDLTLTLCGAIVILPLFAAIAIAIRRESAGPVFYRQKRIGRNGETIRIVKFRTMVCNADEVLNDYLEANPALREEWQRDQKLRNDPRITRIGSLLRRTSLDELPQLWNVLAGEMSLVGPRPIVQAEIIKYGDVFGDYMRVRPGITGLWQVSGRNNLPYDERVRLDRYYICNWSVWFDLWVLAKTVPVVLMRNGAY